MLESDCLIHWGAAGRDGSRRTPAGVLAILALVSCLLTGCDRRPNGSPSSQGKPTTDSSTSAAANSDSNSAWSDEELRRRLDEVIAFTVRERHPRTDTQAAWQIVHGLLSYGRDLQIRHDGQLVSGLDYLLGGGVLDGWKLFKAEHGVSTVVEAGTKTGQGHPDQWLGYLSQCGVKLDDAVTVGGEKFTIRDLVTQAQWEAQEGREGTFTLMALATLLPLDSRWIAQDGQEWTIEKLLGFEAMDGADEANWLSELRNSACGGSHRMFGIATAVKRREESGDAIQGAWNAGRERVRLAIRKAKEHQQPDGSLSTEFFLRAATRPDITDKLHSTGHTLEFLALAMEDAELTEPWMVKSVQYLVGLLERTKPLDLECGALYHASHGLILYRQRRFGEAQSSVADNSR